MPRLQHDERRIATYCREWGPLDCVLTAGDNSAVALRTAIEPRHFRYSFEGQTYAYGHRPEVALSPNGRHFAIARPHEGTRAEYQNHRPCDIVVNGEKRFDAPHGVSRLAWLDSDTLIWMVYPRRERAGRDPTGASDDRVRYFRNGEDVTGNFAFDTTWGAWCRDGLDLHAFDFAAGQWWSVDDRGIAYVRGALPEEARVAAPLDLHRHCWPDDHPQRSGTWRSTQETDGTIRTSYDGGPHGPSISTARGHRVSFGAFEGPHFHAIAVESSMPEFTFSDDRAQVAYVGVQRCGAWAAATQLAAVVRQMPPRALMRAVPVMLHPYSLFFGLPRAWDRARRRYFPATAERSWRTGYPYVDPRRFFFTPSDALVAPVQDGLSGERVVIDEEEGPAFTAVHHVRFLPQDNAVTYIGQRGDDFLRVVVR